MRGENLEKDKIRLDQKLPTMEYSLIFGEGKLWGLINGAAFTPRQDATANFISQHHHSIDSLLRYKECGSTVTLVGKEQQKGLDLFVVDLDRQGKAENPLLHQRAERFAFFGWSMRKASRRRPCEIHPEIPRLSSSSTDARSIPDRPVGRRPPEPGDARSHHYVRRQSQRLYFQKPRRLAVRNRRQVQFAGAAHLCR